MNVGLIDKVLTDMKDYHLPICLVMFLVGSVLTWFHHLDMSFVAYTGTILGAITGHSFSPAGRPDSQKDGDAVQKYKDGSGGEPQSQKGTTPDASPDSKQLLSPR